MESIKKFLAILISKILPNRIMRNKMYFKLWEDKGYHVLPVHFYEPIPDTNTFTNDIFKQRSLLTGIELRENDQLELLKSFSSKYKTEYVKFQYKTSTDNNSFFFENGAFETVDAEILYCMVRSKKPKKIIEIGSGYSTLITSKAIQQNIEEDLDYSCSFICIEPYPKKWLKEIKEISEIIESKIEKLPLDLFKNLQNNDILFIDSSHTINIYNDVCYEYLEILPTLNKGVYVHIHDIILPNVYCKEWFDAKIFWNEQFLLQAFLTFNTKFDIIWAAYYMHVFYPNALTDAFPSYEYFKKHSNVKKRAHGHKSFWIQHKL